MDSVEERLRELEKRAGVMEDRLSDAIKARTHRKLELVESSTDIGGLGTYDAKAIYKIEDAFTEDDIDRMREIYDTIVIRPAAANGNMDHATVVATLSYDSLFE
jgi:hypothetical protein